MPKLNDNTTPEEAVQFAIAGLIFSQAVVKMSVGPDPLPDAVVEGIAKSSFRFGAIFAKVANEQ